MEGEKCMKRLIIIIFVIAIFSLGFYGCTGQESVPPDDENIDIEDQKVTKEVTLYFGDQNATYVAPEKRTISVSDNIKQKDYIKQVMDELIKGPETESLHPTIPQEVKVLSINIEKNIAHIDFSEEMHTKHWGGAAGEAMTINSIANTLTEFDYIDKVKITVEGEPLAIEHMILEEPIGRNEDMIAE